MVRYIKSNGDNFRDSEQNKYTLYGCGIISVFVGFLMFMLFYFLQTKPEYTDYKNYVQDECYISSVNIDFHDCYEEKCNGCGCSAISCGALLGSITNGTCCGAEPCCLGKQCNGCNKMKYTCNWRGTDCDWRWTWDSCCSQTCISTSTKMCQITWGKCSDITIEFFPGTHSDTTSTLEFDCSLNDYNCINQITNSFRNGTMKDCWLGSRVQWSEPSEPKNAWIGAGFGIAFMCLGVLLCMIGRFSS